MYKDSVGKHSWYSLLILNPGNGDADFVLVMAFLLSILVQALQTMCFFSVLRDSVGKDFTLKEVCVWVQ